MKLASATPSSGASKAAEGRSSNGGTHGGADPDLKVDDEGMKLLVHRLRESDDRMQGAVRRLKKVGPKGLGTEGLDDACAEYQGQWENGIDKIGKATKGVTRGLHSALEAYMGNDARVAKIFGGQDHR